MHERIKQLRKTLSLTQQEFADKIGTTRNNIAGYETGRRLPSEAAINLIIARLSVNEEWLRAGKGEMFAKKDRESEISLMVHDLLSGESSDFKARFISVLAGLKDEQWLVLEEKMQEIIGSRTDAPAVSAPTPAPDYEAEARAEAEAYYRKILAEKAAAAAKAPAPVPDAAAELEDVKRRLEALEQEEMAEDLAPAPTVKSRSLFR